jgi:hypothetical protein
MTRHHLTIGLVAGAFALSLAPAWAGQRTNSGDTVGSAVPRGDSGSSSGSSSSGSSGSSGSSSSGGSSSSAGSSGGSSADYPSYRAPRAPENPQRSSGSSQRERAVPRGGGSGDSGTATRSGGGGSGTASTSSADGSGSDSARSRSAVPPYSRPRDGRVVQGEGTERRGPVPTRDGGYPVIYDPYYYGYYDPFYYGYRYGYSPYWAPGYGFGYGYFSYDPYLFGGGYGPYGYGGGYGGGSSSSYGSYRGSGSLRLRVKPGEAQVFVDGYYVGVVDSFDGVFQRLNLDAGPHKVEIKAEGYETAQFDVMVTHGETVTFKGDLKRQ